MEVWGGNEPFDGTVTMAGLDAWVYCRPYRQAAGGGDVYYVSSCAAGQITRLLVADVSGHGDAACGVAGSLRGLMRKNVNHLNQTRFVTAMNEEFAALSQAGCFATAVVTTFFAPTNRLRLSNAGHPPPMWYRGSTGRWSMLEGEGNVPLGIVGGLEYAEFEVELEQGDLVLCYTDSLMEAKGTDGQMLGVGGLMEVVRGIDVTRPQEFISALLKQVGAEHGSNLQGDDVTVLLFRPNQATRHVGFLRRAMAPVRLMGEIGRRVLGGRDPIPWPDRH
jgi:serine phosphatase RsbU (regulator of sigma subunit)